MNPMRRGPKQNENEYKMHHNKPDEQSNKKMDIECSAKSALKSTNMQSKNYDNIFKNQQCEKKPQKTLENTKKYQTKNHKCPKIGEKKPQKR